MVHPESCGRMVDEEGLLMSLFFLVVSIHIGIYEYL